MDPYDEYMKWRAPGFNFTLGRPDPGARAGITAAVRSAQADLVKAHAAAMAPAEPAPPAPEPEPEPEHEVTARRVTLGAGGEVVPLDRTPSPPRRRGDGQRTGNSDGPAPRSRKALAKAEWERQLRRELGKDADGTPRRVAAVAAELADADFDTPEPDSSASASETDDDADGPEQDDAGGERGPPAPLRAVAGGAGLELDDVTADDLETAISADLNGAGGASKLARGRLAFHVGEIRHGFVVDGRGGLIAKEAGGVARLYLRARDGTWLTRENGNIDGYTLSHGKWTRQSKGFSRKKLAEIEQKIDGLGGGD